MTQRITDLLAAAAERAVPVVRGVPDDLLAAPTPCADFTVGDLANHLYQVVVNFQALAAKEQPDWAKAPDYLHGAWRDAFAAEAGRLIDAWAAPDSEEGVSPGMGLPARTVGQMALLDLTVHAWDLARATRQPYEPAPATVAELADLLATMGPTARKMGVFGEPCSVPADADDFTRLLGDSGRDPAWTSGN
ncbi:TIGR03086 family metal-binding protein [Streptodolium elevatio]|uniref:TIGR03086 family metal-binding protein n=1 Tax=Streptodolium elevatio TaxID=3157996 RepID=A0ABV3DDD7_9ACTN